VLTHRSENNIKIGVLTDKPEPLAGFDITFNYVKSCTGRIKPTASHVYNTISCFGDNRTARKKPEWVATSKAGKATRSNKTHRFLWDNICPSVEEYKTDLLELIDKTSKADVMGIHLDCIGFPRAEYCTCLRCTENHKESKLDWNSWRAKTVTDFVGEASKIVKDNGKGFSVTILPDPCCGKERYGEDFQELAKYVDFFLVPLYDLAYSTTYWLENLAYGFHKQLEKPLYVELYASKPGPKLKDILKTMVAVSDYVEGVILATHDAQLSRQIQERLVKDEEFTGFLDRHGNKATRDLVERWKQIL
jgi:hypothetical protein